MKWKKICKANKCKRKELLWFLKLFNSINFPASWNSNEKSFDWHCWRRKSESEWRERRIRWQMQGKNSLVFKILFMVVVVVEFFMQKYSKASHEEENCLQSWMENEVIGNESKFRNECAWVCSFTWGNPKFCEKKIVFVIFILCFST